jgi:putative Holliday junction resolvase
LVAEYVDDPGTTINRKEVSLIDVAASITKGAFQLLGIKSLGVDYGLVRTGLAVTVGFEPKPLAILSALNNTQVCEKVVGYARLEQVQRIIVGLPLHKNGTFAEQTNLTLTFGFELMEHTLRSLGPDVLVYFFDERYTSKEAAARARTRNPRSSPSSSADLYGTLDADAACIILENYYQDNGMGAHNYKLPIEEYCECLKDYQEQMLQRQIQLLNIQNERELRLKTRKEAIAVASEINRIAQALHIGKNKCNRKRKKKRKK